MNLNKGYYLTALQNVSNLSGDIPTIKIVENDLNWEVALALWKTGKPPTDSLEWKKGVFAIFRRLS